jgi:CDP-diacylglycerol--glycerol-3-phosphate 3-phosphatidyltransferase
VLNAKIRAGWDGLLRPAARVVARSRIHPNVITGAGVALQALAAVYIVQGHLIYAFIATFFSGVADVADGAIAKARGITTKFGALFDSTTDRLSDALFFIPIAWLYGVSPDTAARNHPWVAAVALVALVASFLVSYIKARAESLGYDCNVGFAERAERWILMCLALMFNIIPVMVSVLAAAAIVTFLQRFEHVRRQAFPRPGA